MAIAIGLWIIVAIFIVGVVGSMVEVTIKIVGHPDHGFAINPNLVLLISPPSVRKSTQEAVMF